MFLYPLLAPANLGVFDVVVTRLNWSRRVAWLEMVSVAASIQMWLEWRHRGSGEVWT